MKNWWFLIMIMTSAIFAEGIFDQGRLKPFDSFARDVLYHWNGKSSFKKNTASEVVLKVIQEPANTEDWELFKINRADAAELLHLDSKKRYHSYLELKQSLFLLEQYYTREDSHPISLELKRLFEGVRYYELLSHALDYKRPIIELTSDSLKAALALDLKTNLFSPKHLLEKISPLDTALLSDEAKWWRDSLLFQTYLGVQTSPLRIYPGIDNATPVSAWHYLWRGQKIPDFSFPAPEKNVYLRAEIEYHRWNLPRAALFIFGLAIIIGLINHVFLKRTLGRIQCVLYASGGLLLAATLGLRSFIMHAPPFGSLYEVTLLVLVFISWFLVFLYLKKKTGSGILPSGILIFILLFFAQNALLQGDSFKVLPPLLNSSFWLTTHVFTIALGYSGMILSGLWAHVCMVKPSKENKQLLYGILVFGVAFTGVGILLGGVWADLAWGRFWGWDPKECGALFVVIWVMIALHARAGKFLTESGFVFFSAWNMIVIALCWFGINILGIGLHSYGSQNGIALGLLIFILGDALLISFLAWNQRRQSSKSS